MNNSLYRRRKGMFAFGLLLLMSAFVACSGDEAGQGEPQSEETQQGDRFAVSIAADPETLDWMSSPASATTTIAYHVFEQLFTLDQELTVKPMLAEDYEVSEDQQTYTIQLREGVNFHDGSEMKAEDVVASIQRWGSTSGIGLSTFGRVEEIRAVDEYTIEILLNEPFAPLIRNFADPQQALVVMPAEVAEEAGESPLEDDQLVGTGPFEFGGWERGQRITLTRFDDYTSREEDWGGLTGKKVAHVGEVEFSVVPDPQVRLDGMLTGQYHHAGRIPTDSYGQLESNENIRPELSKPNSYLSVGFDHSEPPFDDIRMRQAVSYALDKEEIAQATYGDPEFYELDGSIFFPEQKDLYTLEGADAYGSHDPERARQLMEEAGYDGEPIRLMVTSSFDDHYNSAQIEAEQLREVGFNVDIQTYEWATFLERAQDPSNFDIAVSGFPPAYDPTTVLWFDPEHPGWWESEELGSILSQWSQTRDPQEQERLLAEINRLTYEELPLIKVVNEVGLGAVSTDLEGYESWFSVRAWNTRVPSEGGGY